ncbi:hypothetical protein AA16663_0940 [Komagataeibacter rhaeticus DSM 16663]|nr:hypothetical protein AA16663_0940 [Komagataeibacter rhaeticus DSM 16663]
MAEPQRPHRLQREQGIGHLGFLQADHVGRRFRAETGEQGHPQAEGIDIPGYDTHIGCIADPGGADKNIFPPPPGRAGQKQERIAKGG